MRLTFAGCGSAFTTGTDNYQSNLILSASHRAEDGTNTLRHLLIDCGTDARHSLPRIGIAHAWDIDAVYITHTHADHIGGLEWLALSTHYCAAPRRPQLIVAQEICEPLWNHSLAGGLLYAEEGPASLETYFAVTQVPPNGGFSWEGIDFQLIPVLHVDGGSVRMISYGLFLRAGTQRIYFSADAKFDRELATRFYARNADLIFHDCETGVRSGVHSHYDDLRTLPLELRRKMWLYHYSPGPLPDAHADEFLGFVQRGQSFDFEDPQPPLPQS